MIDKQLLAAIAEDTYCLDTEEPVMKVELHTYKTTEVFLETKNCTVIVTPWSNCEGINLMMTGKDLSLRMCGALTWEEAQAIMTALSAVQIGDSL